MRGDACKIYGWADLSAVTAQVITLIGHKIQDLLNTDIITRRGEKEDITKMELQAKQRHLDSSAVLSKNTVTAFCLIFS